MTSKGTEKINTHFRQKIKDYIPVGTWMADKYKWNTAIKYG